MFFTVTELPVIDRPYRAYVVFKECLRTLPRYPFLFWAGFPVHSFSEVWDSPKSIGSVPSSPKTRDWRAAETKAALQTHAFAFPSSAAPAAETLVLSNLVKRIRLDCKRLRSCWYEQHDAPPLRRMRPALQWRGVRANEASVFQGAVK